MFLHSAGGVWTSVYGPSYSDITQLNAVKAISPTLAWSAGYTENVHSQIAVPLIERWSGGPGWEAVITTSNIITLTSGMFNGVDANSASHAWAVGYYLNDSAGASQSLALHWNGTSWSVVSTPIIPFVRTQLNGVSALSSSDVWATGCYIYTNSCGGTLTMQWDGTSWKIFNSQDINSNGNIFYGIAMTSHSDGWSVGYTSPGIGVGNTLIERWFPNPTWWP